MALPNSGDNDRPIIDPGVLSSKVAVAALLLIETMLMPLLEIAKAAKGALVMSKSRTSVNVTTDALLCDNYKSYLRE